MSHASGQHPKSAHSAPNAAAKTHFVKSAAAYPTASDASSGASEKPFKLDLSKLVANDKTHTQVTLSLPPNSSGKLYVDNASNNGVKIAADENGVRIEGDTASLQKILANIHYSASKLSAFTLHAHIQGANEFATTFNFAYHSGSGEFTMTHNSGSSFTGDAFGNTEYGLIANTKGDALTHQSSDRPIISASHTVATGMLEEKSQHGQPSQPGVFAASIGNPQNLNSSTDNTSPDAPASGSLQSNPFIAYDFPNTIITAPTPEPTPTKPPHTQTPSHPETPEDPHKPVIIDPPKDAVYVPLAVPGSGGATSSAAPLLSGVNTPVTFMENTVNATPQLLDNDVTLADSDSPNFAGGKVTVSLTGAAAEDQLAVQNVGNGAGQIGVAGANVSFGGTLIGTIAGGTNGSSLVVTLNSAATPAATEALIEHITYLNTSNTPGAARTANITVDDGSGGVSLAQNIVVNVTAENDAPVVANTTTPTTFLENTVNASGQVINAGITLTDDNADLNGGNVTVSYSAGGGAQDQLTVQNVGGGAGQIGVAGANVSYGGTLIGTITTNGVNGANLVVTLNASATPAAVQALLANITYGNTSDTPAAARTVAITVNDGAGATSAAQNIVINVTGENDAPVLGGVTSPATFLENTINVTPALIDSSVTLTDIDSANFNGGNVTVTLTGGGAEDQLSVRNIGGGAGQIGVAGANVSYAGTLIGTVAGGVNGANLVITLNASADAAATKALVEAIQYGNSSDTPTAARTAVFTVNDGAGGTSASQSVVINVTAENDAPVVGSVNTPVTYLENTVNATPQVLDSSVTLVDADSADFNGGTVTVAYSAGGGAEDQLTVQNVGNGAGQIGVAGANVSYGGTLIGTITTSGANGANLVITLNASSTAASTKALVEAITYQNTSDTPTAARTISITVNDGDGGTSLAQNIVTNVTAENDAPALGGVNSPVTFLENTVNASAQLLDSSVTLTDADSANFNGGNVTVTLTGGGAEDQLSIRNIGGGAGQIGVAGANVSYGGTLIGTAAGGANGANLVVTLNASATVAATKALVEAIQYANTSDTPTAARTAVIAVNDGTTSSATQSIVINVTPETEPPILGGLSASVTFMENSVNAAPAIIDNSITLTDADSANFNGGNVTVTLTGGGAEDQLSVKNIGNGAGQIGVAGANVSYAGTQIGTITTNGVNGANLVITLNASADATATKALIEAIQYANTSDTPTAARTAVFTVADGTGNTSVAQSVTVNVTAEADGTAPVLGGLTASVTYLENTANATWTLLDTSVTLTDADSANFNTGNVRVRLTGGAAIEDQLSVRNIGTGVGQIGVAGANVSYEGTLIGTITSNGVNAADLIITLNASATVAATKALIEAIQYMNTTDNPVVARTGYITVTDETGLTSVQQGIMINITPEAETNAFTLTAGADSFIGGTNTDTFTTTMANLAAADTLIGGAGTDSLIITDAATVTAALLANKSGIDAIQFNTNATSVTLGDTFIDASDDGKTLLLNNGTNMILSLNTSAVSASNDVVIGGTGFVMMSGSGNRVIIKDGVNGSIQSNNSDTIIGGTGNDAITGNGATTIIGGGGADTLYANSNATYVYTALTDSTTANSDTIDTLYVGQTIDVSALGFTGIQAGAAAGTTLGFTNNGTQTFIVNAAGTFRIVLNGVRDPSPMMRFGTSTFTLTGGSDNVIGTASGDYIYATAANFAATDTITAGAGVDVMEFSTAASGADAINAAKFVNVTGLDQINLKANGNQLTITDAMVDQTDGGSRLIINSTGSITSLDTSGVNATNDVMIYSFGGITLANTAGNRVLLGDTLLTNTITDGTGADTIIAGNGFENITINNNTNNISLGGSNDQITISGANYVATNTIDGGAGTGDSLTFSSAVTAAAAAWANKSNIETFTFANATSAVTIPGGYAASANPIRLIGTAMGAAATLTVDASANTANFSITGGAGDDSFTGGAGNDTLIGNDGADNLTLGGGTNSVVGGNGNDMITVDPAVLVGTAQTISGGAGADTLVINNSGNVTAVSLANVTGIDTFIGTGAINWTLPAGYTSDQATLMISNVVGPANIDATGVGQAIGLYASSAAPLNDTILGSAFNDTITGWRGDDYVHAGAGNDEVRWTAQLEINGNDTHIGGAGTDTLMGGVAILTITAADLANTSGFEVFAPASSVGAAMLVTLPGGYAIDTGTSIAFSARFGDTSNTFNASALATPITVTGGTAADVYVGGTGADSIFGNLGGDTINLGVDAAADRVVYENSTEGAAAGGNTGYDIISNFNTANDMIYFTSNFRVLEDDSPTNMDFNFTTNAAMNANTTEGMLITGMADADLTQANFVNIRTQMGVYGVTANVNADALIVVQGATQTAFFAYLESEAGGNTSIAAGELRLMGIADALLGTANFDFI